MLLRAAFGMAAKMVVVAIGCHNRIDLRFTTCKSTFFFVCAQFSGQISRCQAEVYAGETEIVDEAARRN